MHKFQVEQERLHRQRIIIARSHYDNEQRLQRMREKERRAHREAANTEEADKRRADRLQAVREARWVRTLSCVMAWCRLIVLFFIYHTHSAAKAAKRRQRMEERLRAVAELQEAEARRLIELKKELREQEESVEQRLEEQAEREREERDKKMQTKMERLQQRKKRIRQFESESAAAKAAAISKRNARKSVKKRQKEKEIMQNNNSAREARRRKKEAAEAMERERLRNLERDLFLQGYKERKWRDNRNEIKVALTELKNIDLMFKKWVSGQD